jgi:hypothetical protein
MCFQPSKYRTLEAREERIAEVEAMVLRKATNELIVFIYKGQECSV